MNPFSLLPLPWKIAVVSGLIAAAVLVYGGWRHGIYKEGYDACKVEQSKAIEKGRKKYEESSVEIRRLSDADLRKRYCVWVRDRPDLCLKSYTPFLP